ncbi:MAG: twin-arginine translocase TatA/TatE family subunit [Corynebacterium variabile]|uniref:Sec-independent protein translocase subunit TatA/TatB n=2 Tax=Corynebacterium variabile TaxID=1727 RepID=UPI00264A4939|nr:twin-arginine translocase TatA/TatE family subunit [Corynebacterium variabile]MDN6843834.1 twin-arginine translocase TatA/TatE family subunit [Corynebacterium variabile]
MFANLTGMHAVVILAIVFLLFGAAKLPGLAKSVGQSVRILKKEVNEDENTAAAEAAVTTDTAVVTTVEPVAVPVATVAAVPTTVAAAPAATQQHRISSPPRPPRPPPDAPPGAPPGGLPQCPCPGTCGRRRSGCTVQPSPSWSRRSSPISCPTRSWTSSGPR